MIPHQWSIPDSIRERVGVQTLGRQRAIIEEGHLLLILHRQPGPDQDHREGALFWRTPEGQWKSNLGSGRSIETLKDFLQDYHQTCDQLEEAYEKAHSTSDLFSILERVIPVNRASTHLFETIQHARENLREYTDLIEIRDVAYDNSRRYDLLLQDTKNAADFKVARDSEAQAELSREALRASHKLNLLAAMFFPLTALTSLFGMNFKSGLGDHVPFMFWIILATGIVTGIFIKSWVLRSREP
ncbi:MAG: CorA family divalent cation transporter [Verrucomicrobiota bacterium]